MATVPPPARPMARSAARTGPRRRRWAMVLVAALLALGAVLWPKIEGFTTLGAAYGARLACSCHYIAGRPLSACKDDFEPGMGLVSLSADDATRSVTARYLIFARQTATRRDGPSCQLEPWN